MNASGLTGEFDSGSEQTLAACLIHASRTRKYLRVRVQWRTGEEYIGNLPSGGEQPGETQANTA